MVDEDESYGHWLEHEVRPNVESICRQLGNRKDWDDSDGCPITHPRHDPVVCDVLMIAAEEIKALKDALTRT